MSSSTPAIRLLVCGDRHARDGGVAVWAAGLLMPIIRQHGNRHVEVMRCGHLDSRQLLDVGAAAPLVILDVADGLPPGEIVIRALDELIDDPSGPSPRCAAGQPIDQMLGVANVLGDSPLRGCFVGIGGHDFGFGETLSPPVRRRLPDYVEAIRALVEPLVKGEEPVSGACLGARGGRPAG
jgi:hydrogenase maturation protease